MTSISGSMSAAQMLSPNARMQAALQSAVSAGTVKSTDQSALSSALDDIDTAMKASGPRSAGTEPGQMKTKIDSLIDKEVSDGKLTDDQGTELKKVFSDAAASMKASGAHGAHHAGGPPPTDMDGDSTSDDGTGTDTTSTASTTSTDSTDTTKSAIEQLVSFLKKLEDSMTSTSPYTSSGASTASATTSSVLINSLA